MIPDAEKLNVLIHQHVEWSAFYAEVEATNRHADLLAALRQLPDSSIRDARIARIMSRLGQIDEALALLYQHKGCQLCKAWYFAILTRRANEAQLKMMAESLNPDISVNTGTDVEARFRLLLAIATAANQIGRHTQADIRMFDAIKIAKMTGDQNAEWIASYELARMRLFRGDFSAATHAFKSVMQGCVPNSLMYIGCQEYLGMIAWMQSSPTTELPLHMQKAITELQGQFSRDDYEEAPEAFLPWVARLFRKLGKLYEHYHLNFMLMHIEEVAEERQQLVDAIIKHAGANRGEINGFVSHAVVALAKSLHHDLTALEHLNGSFRHPTTGIPVLSLMYYATKIQIHANLPELPRGPELDQAAKMMIGQFKHLPEGEQQFLITWMKNFTPVVMYLLSERFGGLQKHVEDYVVVTYERAKWRDRKYPGCPKKYMVRLALDVLSGQKLPRKGRTQAYRHREAMEQYGVYPLILQPVLDLISPFINPKV